ncbi:MAG: hypothetical protein CMJ81_13750 [Planctomycetaceae bacterium]|nr:hypothetical protein [Planctomycetaceae bacterium]
MPVPFLLKSKCHVIQEAAKRRSSDPKAPARPACIVLHHNGAAKVARCKVNFRTSEEVPITAFHSVGDQRHEIKWLRCENLRTHASGHEGRHSLAGFLFSTV